jgi:hypothetical protein
MKVVRPYVDENKQVIFVEIEHELLHEVVNGFLLALIVFVPLGVLSP